MVSVLFIMQLPVLFNAVRRPAGAGSRLPPLPDDYNGNGAIENGDQKKKKEKNRKGRREESEGERKGEGKERGMIATFGHLH